MRDRLHGLRRPDSTSCGRHGRVLEIGPTGKSLQQVDRLLRIAPTFDDIDCKACLKGIARHGRAFLWHDVPPHPDSVATAKRARNRRRIR